MHNVEVEVRRAGKRQPERRHDKDNNAERSLHSLELPLPTSEDDAV